MASAVSTIGLERFEMIRGQSFQRHVHDVHQLAWASHGVLLVDVDDRYWVLPPHLALWIPAGVWHATVALRETVLQGIYLDPAGTFVDWSGPTVLAVDPLARQLIGYLAGDLTENARLRAESVLLDVVRPAAGGTIELPMPRDRRARDVAELLLADPTDRRGLETLAHSVGSSARTVLRLFVAETGLTFNQWRIHVRLQAAVTLLAEGRSVSRIAELVGYATPSAFVAAFHRVTGSTPTGYFEQVTPRATAPRSSGPRGGSATPWRVVDTAWRAVDLPDTTPVGLGG
jgi:AraC-like DNA-binding protein